MLSPRGSLSFLFALTLGVSSLRAVAQAAATPADQLTVPAGFKVELLHSATPREGSWVSMAIDPKGRLYISPQNAAPDGNLFRVTIGKPGEAPKFEAVPLKVSGAMGMLWAFDSLYFSGDGPEGHGIYRLRDTDGDDQLDSVQLFKKVPGGGGEHGAHAIVLGPDNLLYFTHGNATPPLEDFADRVAAWHIGEDYLLPRIKDPVATFFDNLKVPYGQVLRTDAEGKKWELFASGFRNAYDIAFNPDGELFTYDSDMEWDVGLPWYRPTRILHIPQRAEFGFREGSTKWPEFYADSVPSISEIGLGCPTGMAFGTKSNFPAPYRAALFALDWTFGRVLAVHLTPHGSTYDARFEDFLKGKGMPVTDLEFGPDGAMYLIVGGRGTQSGLYRVSYVGASDAAAPAATGAPAAADLARAAEARQLRHRLEGYENHEDPAALDAAWPQLRSEDRLIRYAARVAIESQPLSQWRERALSEPDARAGLTALLALSRCGAAADRDDILKALAKWPLDSLDEPLKLDKLHLIELTMARHGAPEGDLRAMAIEKLGRQYPAASFPLNRELAQLLTFLQAPGAIEKTLVLLETATKPEEQIWYAYCLRAARGPWQPEQQERFFRWFAKARDYKGGNSFGKFIEKMRDEALTQVPAERRSTLLAIAQKLPPPAAAAPAAPVRQFVKAWTVAELTPALGEIGKGRNFARGKEIFTSALCLQCHHFGQDGGNVGPDLSAVANRFNRHDLLEAIIEPSKAISEQYAAFIVNRKNGDALVGQIAEENDKHLIVITDPLAGKREEIAKADFVSKQPSPVSLMPPGLINNLSKDEIFDLLAYIESAGNQGAALFSK